MTSTPTSAVSKQSLLYPLLQTGGDGSLPLAEPLGSEPFALELASETSLEGIANDPSDVLPRKRDLPVLPLWMLRNSRRPCR